MMTENFVLTKIIDDAPGFTKDQNVPSTSAYSMTILPWARSTVPWSLRCEAENGMKRDKAHQMFALLLDSNFHAKKAENAGFAFWVTLTVLYGIALLGCCSRKVIFFCFYTSRIVIFICLCIMIHHLGQMLHRINFSRAKLDYFKDAVKYECMDDYSLLNQRILQHDLDEAWQLLSKGLAFSCVVLVITLTEMCCGVSCLPILAHPRDYVQNVKSLFKEEVVAFLWTGFLKFN